MAKQRFSAVQREAIWLAYGQKCAYTRELLDISNFHIDHIIPESLMDDPQALSETLVDLGLPEDFDIQGWSNLVPSRPGANLQKGVELFDHAHVHFFLGIANGKREEIEAHLVRIDNRRTRGKAIVLLQQCLERGDLTPDEIAQILHEHSEQPEQIFELIESLKFFDHEEVKIVRKSDIESLRDRPIRFGKNYHIDGITLVHDSKGECYVRTCREYDNAIEDGYYAPSNTHVKLSVWFEHQSGLLKLLQKAATPLVSFVSEPKVGIIDLELMPFSFFPRCGGDLDGGDPSSTYQSKIDDGSIFVKRIRQNLLVVEETEGMGQQLIEVARADFNQDGIEDILLFEYYYATHGTAGFGGIRVLTRKSLDDKFEIL